MMMRESHTSLSGPSWWKQSDLCCPSYCPRGCHPPLRTKTWPSHSPPDSKHWKTNEGEKIDLSLELWVHAFSVLFFFFFGLFFSTLSHVSFKEEVQQHPFRSDLGKVQRMVQSVSESNELGDFFKSSILIRLDDILWGLQWGETDKQREGEQAMNGQSRWEWNRIAGRDGLTSFWLEWKNLREKLHDWEAAANWPRDSA